MHDLTLGGAQSWAVTLATEMAAAGEEVDLVLVRREGMLLQRVPPSVRVVELGYRKTLFAIPALAAYLRRRKPIALISGLHPPNIAAILARILSRANVPLIVTEHSVATMAGPTQPLGGRIGFYLLRHLYPKADMIVGVSDAVSSDLADHLRVARSLVRTIYNPIDLDRIASTMDEPNPHPWLADNGYTAVTAGRLENVKDIPTMLKAISVARRTTPVRLIILGNGSLREELLYIAEKLGISDAVDFVGPVDNPFSYFHRASLFVLSSTWEGFGNVLVEALACGVPVVSTDCPGGPGEILDFGTFGRLVPVGNVEELAAAIVETLSSRPDKQILKRRAESFSGPLAASLYIQLSNELAAK